MLFYFLMIFNMCEHDATILIYFKLSASAKPRPAFKWLTYNSQLLHTGISIKEDSLEGTRRCNAALHCLLGLTTKSIEIATKRPWNGTPSNFKQIHRLPSYLRCKCNSFQAKTLNDDSNQPPTGARLTSRIKIIFVLKWQLLNSRVNSPKLVQQKMPKQMTLQKETITADTI